MQPKPPKKYLKNGKPWLGHWHTMKDGKMYTHAVHRETSKELFFLKDLSKASQRIALLLSLKYK